MRADPCAGREGGAEQLARPALEDDRGLPGPRGALVEYDRGVDVHAACAGNVPGPYVKVVEAHFLACRAWHQNDHGAAFDGQYDAFLSFVQKVWEHESVGGAPVLHCLALDLRRLACRADRMGEIRRRARPFPRAGDTGHHAYWTSARGRRSTRAHGAR